MRYILYFDQYQCRFGGCTHAACYFSAYYSIAAVVSACAFAGFEKNAPCLSIFYTYSASFFSCRRRAVLPTAVSLSVQLILFTSFFHSGLPPLGVPYASSIAGLLCVSVSACVVCCVAVLPCCVKGKRRGSTEMGRRYLPRGQGMFCLDDAKRLDSLTSTDIIVSGGTTTFVSPGLRHAGSAVYLLAVSLRSHALGCVGDG